MTSTAFMMTSRRDYTILLIGTVAIGLAVHLHGIGLATPVRDVLGDALWAAMIFWLISVATPRAGLTARVAAALAICFTVELSQLVKHPVLDDVRRSTLGHLVLGSDFDPRDLAAYAAGVLAALLIDQLRHPR
jgi:hypothetical protein